MEQIRAISAPLKNELARQSDVSASLTIRSGPPLPEGMGSTLLTMMAQTQARYPNQALAEGTPDMYLVEWEEMALNYGLPMFREGLLKAIRNSRFFPDPLDIREQCIALRRSEIMREDAKRISEEVGRWKQQWERERQEEPAFPFSPILGRTPQAVDRPAHDTKTCMHCSKQNQEAEAPAQI
jgi:hypothetical protein